MSMQILYEAAATGTVYGTVGGIFKSVADSWAALNDTEKIALYQQIDEGNAELSSPITLGKFIVHAYISGENIAGIARPIASGNGEWKNTAQDGAGIYTPLCKITAVPLPQTIKPKNILPLPTASTVTAVTIAANIDSTNRACVAVTADGQKYQTYNFSAAAWEDIDVNNTAAMLKSGIPIATLGSIPPAAWAALKKGLGLAYCLSQTAADTACRISALKLTAAISGRWDRAVYNKDYRYGYTGNSTLQLTFLEAGSFKINYTDADSSREITSAQEPIGLSIKENSTDECIYTDEQGDKLL